MPRVLLLLVVVAVLLAAPTLILGDRFDVMLDGDRAFDFIRAQRSWGGVVGIGLIMADLFVPIPTSAVMAALGLVYGSGVGGAFASAGSFCAGLLGYGLCRLIGPRAAAWIAGEQEISRLTGFFARYGLWAIALSRWMPAVPEVLACLAGVTRMAIIHFTIGNLVGSVAVGFAYAYFGARGEDNPGAALAAAVILPYLALPIFFLLFARRSKTAQRDENARGVQMTSDKN
jgi:uncharacterized membrane protein YdjX (TVP38/TMEM64 family)